MPRSKQRNSLLNRRVSESAKWRRENAKYVKYPKTSNALGAEQLLQRESWCTQQRRVWADTYLTMAVLPRHTALTAHRFCRGASPRNPGDSSAKQWSLTDKTDTKVWVLYKMNARRKTHRGVATKTRAHAKVLWLECKLRPQRRTLLRWEKHSKKRKENLYFENYILVQHLFNIKKSKPQITKITNYVR